MILKGKLVFDNFEEFMKVAADSGVRIGDELITKDIDGKAKFVVADKAAGHIVMVRKHCLKKQRPIRNENFDLFEWLNGEYVMSIPKKIRKAMMIPTGQMTVDIPREIEVFGKNEYGIHEEGHQWPYFKKTKNRICTVKSDDEYSHWWWCGTPTEASAAYFCDCDDRGDACCATAGNASYYVRPRFILAVAES